MCVDVPARVVSVDPDGSYATTDRSGTAKRVSLVMLELQGRRPRPGDWIAVNSGLAVRVLTEAEAIETFHWYREMEEGS